jgi:hypothetical protein
MKAGELARLASAPVKQVREVLADLRQTYLFGAIGPG